MPSANDKPPGWWARHGSRFVRFLLALAVFATITVPMALNGRAIVSKDLKDFATVTKTATETSGQKASNESRTESLQKVDQQIRNEQVPAKIEKVEESALPRVYAYMLQLAAWCTVLAVSLWAMVALTNDQ